MKARRILALSMAVATMVTASTAAFARKIPSYTRYPCLAMQNTVGLILRTTAEF